MIPSLRAVLLSALPRVLLSVVLAFGVVGIIAAPLPACSPAQQAKEVSGGIHLALCVYQHEDEPPAAIVAACAGSTLEDVTAILTAQRASRARYAAAGCPSADAGARAPNYGPGK